MSMEDTFESLFSTQTDELSTEKLVEMFFNPKGINMKTEIPTKALMYLVVLEAYADRIKEIGFKKTYKRVKKIIQLYKEEMVSRDRLGRGEGKDMLGAIREKLKSDTVFSKLLGINREEK